MNHNLKSFGMFMDKIMKYVKIKLRVMNGFLYNIENISQHGDLLNISGWIFHTRQKIKSVELVLQSKGVTVILPVDYGFTRKDVGEMYKWKNSYASGAQIKVKYQSSDSVRIMLRIEAEKDKKVISLGKIPANSEKMEFNAELLEHDMYKLIKQILKKEIAVTDYSKYKCDIIVPVYNGVEYLQRLFETIQQTKVRYRIIFVNDCSPDKRVEKLLSCFEKENNNVVVLKNERNLGFVGSVNKALEYAEYDVALVNTDVELPAGWLERLMKPIFEHEDVASTTPYSNSATIFSFPNMGENNLIYHGLSVDEVDEIFSKVCPSYESVPTGMGFCMGMSRKALSVVGKLDYETFTKGYGEENDWCQRAMRKGFRNVQVENLFVYHKHGGSFVSEEKKALLEKNLKILKDRYPNYDEEVMDFVCRDPNREVRYLVQLILDANKAASAVTLAFDHNLGGGAKDYIERKKREAVNRGELFLVVRYDNQQNQYIFECDTNEYSREYVFRYFEQIVEITETIKIDKIIVNELVSYADIDKVLENIVQITENKSAELEMLLHDYYAFCPSVNLLKEDGEYCGLPQNEVCQRCYEKYEYSQLNKCDSIVTWQGYWKKFFAHCTRIIAFSNDTVDKFEKVFGKMEQVCLIPHQVNYIQDLEKKYKITKTFNIAVLGTLTEHKGLHIVEELLKYIRNNQRDTTLMLIGEMPEHAKGILKELKQTGRYDVSDLPELILKNDIDLILIPSIWPETFSYTTEESMKLKIPVACFDFGAPAERVKNYEKGIILSSNDARVIMDEIHQGIKKIGISEMLQNEVKNVLFVAEKRDFATRYRAEHLQEQLLRKGICSELYTIDEIPRHIDWNKVNAVMIYRCQNCAVISNIVKEAHARMKTVYYDVDDLVFDYEQIKNLPFLMDEEYSEFEKYTQGIYASMKVADKIITSTETLKHVIQKTFPEKEVLLNRNVASEKMWILSRKALEQKSKSGNRITLGYFSGSHTHNGDFELIESALLDVMIANTNVYLKIVGCLNLPEQFQKVEERIERIGFVDWTRLPELIASIDVNLMPLEDTIFHACKSENKWMEAAMVKVPTIASFNGELNLCTKDGEDIILCHNEQEWRKNLEEMVRKENLRISVGEAAWKHVCETKRTNNLTETIEEFIK